MTTSHGWKRRSVVLGVAAILAAASGFVSAQAGEAPQAVAQDWPKDVQAVARLLIEQYGLPDMAGDNALVWINNGPWRKTFLHRKGFTQPLIGEGRDHLEQVIAYAVPENKVAELKKFDKRLNFNQRTGELSSRADTESMNYLALNLADDIVKGDRTAQEARAFYRKVKTLEKTGKSSPYLDGLIFTVKIDRTKEPIMIDEPGPLYPKTNRRKTGYPPDYFDVPTR